MRLSAKSRYALASTIHMAQNNNNNEYITLISISDKLNISKIYLEQVFSLLKRSGIVTSIKGSQGGYQLASDPKQISAYEILTAVETSLFEDTEETLTEEAPEVEGAMKSLIYNPLDEAVKSMLLSVTLSDLVAEADKNKPDHGFMFFI